MNKMIIGIDVSKNDLDVFGKMTSPSSWGSIPIIRMVSRPYSKTLKQKDKSIMLILSLQSWNLPVVTNSTLHTLHLANVGKSVFLIPAM